MEGCNTHEAANAGFRLSPEARGNQDREKWPLGSELLCELAGTLIRRRNAKIEKRLSASIRKMSLWRYHVFCVTRESPQTGAKRGWRTHRDPGRAEAEARDLCAYAGGFRAPADHSVYVLLGHGKIGELARNPGAVEVFLQVFFKIVVAGHLMALSPFLVKPHPGAPALDVYVFDAHPGYGPDAREGIDHGPDDCPIAEAKRRAYIDRGQEVPGLAGGKDRGLALLYHVLGTLYRGSRVLLHHLGNHQVVEEHPDCGEFELHRGDRDGFRKFLDVGGDVKCPDQGQVGYPASLAPGRECAGGVRVGLAGILVPDLRREELHFLRILLKSPPLDYRLTATWCSRRMRGAFTQS